MIRSPRTAGKTHMGPKRAQRRPLAAVAKPRKVRKPSTSVTVVSTMDEAAAMGLPAVLAAIRATATGPTYVSLDIDAADPAFAPGTGTPEVGGFTSHELLRLVRGLRGLELVGFDLVEVSPPYDHGDITAILAANLAFEFLSLWAAEKR